MHKCMADVYIIHNMYTCARTHAKRFKKQNKKRLNIMRSDKREYLKSKPLPI